MAKSKSTSSAKSVSASRRKSSESTNGRQAAKKPAAAKGPRNLSTDEIGLVAGQIWSVLSSDGGQSLANIKKAVDAPADLILAAIGWLAREDKLEFSTSGRTQTIALR